MTKETMFSETVSMDDMYDILKAAIADSPDEDPIRVVLDYINEGWIVSEKY